MSQPVTCPHCAAALRVPPGATAAELLCPRCRGRLPNPEGAPLSDDLTFPVLALDDEVNAEVRASRRGLGKLAGMSAIVLAVMGVATGLVGGLMRNYDGIGVLFGGAGLTLLVFALVAAAALLKHTAQTGFLRRSGPEGFGRVVAIALLWMLSLFLAVFAAFAVFFVACWGGLFAGGGMR